MLLAASLLTQSPASGGWRSSRQTGTLSTSTDQVNGVEASETVLKDLNFPQR